MIAQFPLDHEVELGSKGAFPSSVGIRLKYRKDIGQLITPGFLTANPEAVVDYIDDWAKKGLEKAIIIKPEEIDLLRITPALFAQILGACWEAAQMYASEVDLILSQKTGHNTTYAKGKSEYIDDAVKTIKDLHKRSQ